MEEYKVKQIAPSHADHISHYKDSFVDNLFKESKVVVQRKYDGERMLVHFNGNETYCTSRRISKQTGHYMENQDKIVDLPKLNLGYTIIDCEFYSDTWADAVGILHSLPERAYQLQQSTKVKFAVFDCLYFDGINIMDQPYEVRLQYVRKVLSLLNDERFHIVEEQIVNNKEEAYSIAKSYWDKGMEGVVLKPYNKAYYDKGAMLKIKRTETLDVVVCGKQDGNGKYSNMIGALYVGYYDNGNIIKISKVNCGTDSERQYWTENFDKLVNKTVIEVKCQEITDKSLRHPVYLRIRDDKSPEMCTRETIFK